MLNIRISDPVTYFVLILNYDNSVFLLKYYNAVNTACIDTRHEYLVNPAKSALPLSASLKEKYFEERLPPKSATPIPISFPLRGGITYRPR